MTQTEVLVAGHQGFIGGNLWSDREESWVGIDLQASPSRDTTDVELGKHCGVLVLLAARLDHSRDMYQHNLDIYAWLARETRKSPQTHVIFASSAAVYPETDVPVKEDRVAKTPPTLYGRSKLLGEQVVKDSTDNWTILRFANVYGRGEGNGVVDLFRRGVTTIYGDGRQVRDYISVQKVCGAIGKIIQNPTGYNQETYNISSGVGKTVHQVWAEYGYGEATHEPARSFDVQYSVLDNRKAKSAGLL